MSLLQALIIALLGYLGSLYGTFLFGTVGGWSVIGRPLVAGAIIGAILGDIKTGILVGAAIQALYVGLVTPGLSVPGDINFASYIAIPLAIVGKTSTEYAVSLAVPLSFLGVAAVYAVASFNTVFVHLQDKWIREGKLKAARNIPILSNISQFVVRFFPIFLACYFGAGYAGALSSMVPDWLSGALQVLGGILPAIGFALLIQYTLKAKSDFIYVVVGFIMISSLNLSIIPVTIIAMLLALIDYQANGWTKITGGGSNV